MELTKTELELIMQTERAFKRTKVARVILLSVMLVGLTSMLFGLMDPDTFAYFSLAICLYALVLPQLGGPKYDDIVVLLARVRAEAAMQPGDALTDALNQKL